MKNKSNNDKKGSPNKGLPFSKFFGLKRKDGTTDDSEFQHEFTHIDDFIDNQNDEIKINTHNVKVEEDYASVDLDNFFTELENEKADEEISKEIVLDKNSPPKIAVPAEALIEEPLPCVDESDLYEVEDEIDDAMPEDLDYISEEQKEDEGEYITDGFTVEEVVESMKTREEIFIQETSKSLYDNKGQLALNEEEFEALMSLFETLTLEEIEALPKDYKELFYENFERDAKFVDAENTKAVKEKLGISADRISLSENVSGNSQDVKDEVHKRTITEKLQMTSDDKEDLKDMESMYSNNNQIAVEYVEESVIDILEMPNNEFGLYPYLVYVNGKLVYSNYNREISIAEGSTVIVRTFVKIKPPFGYKIIVKKSEQLLKSLGLEFDMYRISTKGIDIQLKAVKSARLEKYSIVGICSIKKDTCLNQGD